MKSMMTILMNSTVTPIKRALHCLMDRPCWKEISGRKLWFPRSLVSHRGVLFIANLVQEKETAKPYKAWQSTGSYRSMPAKENSCHWSCHSTYLLLYFNAFVKTAKLVSFYPFLLWVRQNMYVFFFIYALLTYASEHFPKELYDYMIIIKILLIF